MLEVSDLDTVLNDAEEYRWYAVPNFYLVKLIDKDGNSSGYVRCAFFNKKKAIEVAKELHGVVCSIN